MNNFPGVSNSNSEPLDPNCLITAENCPVCGGQSKELLRMTTINPRSKDQVALKECLFCAHWWHNPLVEQKYLSKLYSEDSEFVVSLQVLPKLNVPPESELQKFAEPILTDFPKGKKFNYLEIGSASGHLLAYFSRSAQIAYGVEPARAEDSPNVVSDLDELPENIKFDCVVIQDVLEHISDPGEMLKKIRSKVNSGGMIYAGFPNKDSFKARFMKSNWSMVRPVGHLHYFSSKSINIIFGKTGWKTLEKRGVRMGNDSAWEIVKRFNYKINNLPYRLVKSLLLGQLILGKDQWKVKAIAE